MSTVTIVQQVQLFSKFFPIVYIFYMYILYIYILYINIIFLKKISVNTEQYIILLTVDTLLRVQ